MINYSKSINILIIGIALISLISACTNNSNIKMLAEDEIARKLIEWHKTNSLNANQKLIILKKDFCSDTDCDEYFRNFSEQIEILKIEDAFMRGYKDSDYIIIKEIDEKNRKVVLNSNEIIQ